MQFYHRLMPFLPADVHPSVLVKRVAAISRGKLPVLHEVTPLIQRFADGFKGKDVKTLNKMVRSVLYRIKEHSLNEKDADLLTFLYLRRTADEIIQTKFVKHDAPTFRVGGCQDQCTLATALLKAKGFENGKHFWYVRDKEFEHSYLLLKIGKKTFKVDLFYTGKRNDPLDEQTAVDLERLEYLRKEGRVAVGTDAFHVGIRGLRDAVKYAAAKARKNARK